MKQHLLILQEPQEPRRTSRTINTPSYLKDYTYTLPKLHSLNTFVSHNNHVCFNSLCSDSQQLVKAISHE